ncbi:uncharacterized protein [Diabrotica undecimpunctata]|uniref:uncharacterized protein n=1 Tax=Diabrotica undecimpunctata TaxID=50387 RepID=UPI003B635876
MSRRYLTQQELLECLQNLSEDESVAELSDEDVSDNEVDEYVPNTVDQGHSSGSDSEGEVEIEVMLSTSASTSNTDFNTSSEMITNQVRGIRRSNLENSSIDTIGWELLDNNASTPGKRTSQNVLNEATGPTPHAKRSIIRDSAASAWRLLIDECILRNIKSCTVAEGRRKLKDENWQISIEEIEAFISLLYAREDYMAQNVSIKMLWSGTWGPQFFQETMSRNKFTEIMSFIRFDMRNTRSERLSTDKFALGLGI